MTESEYRFRRRVGIVVLIVGAELAAVLPGWSMLIGCFICGLGVVALPSATQIFGTWPARRRR